MTTLLGKAEGQYLMIYFLNLVTGMRISETVAIEIDKHIEPDCSIIYVRQQREKDVNARKPHLKTEAGLRDVDLHPDHMGHMNVMWYTGKFDEACWQLLAMLGLRPSRFAEDGTGMVAVEQRIEYKRELHAGDAVRIQSSVSEVTDNKMVDDVTGELAATTVVVGVHIDVRIRKAIRLPDDVRQKAFEMKDMERHLRRRDE
jgi:acyl-CoA thioester hydrolase